MSDYDRAKETADVIRASVGDFARIGVGVGVVLGSGLGDFGSTLTDAVSIPYERLPHWPASQVVGHEGRLIVGRANGHPVAALAGRCHLYEGHGARAVTSAVRTLGVLGIKTLILTNAAGGINTAFAPGALMVIDDHINLTGANPLVGLNDDRLGTRFPDMTDAYSSRLRGIAHEAGGALGVPLVHGIYAGLGGPSYETPAEIRYLRTIGADAVGMSTVLEAIAARHMGIEVLGISCITNMAAGVVVGPLAHEDVIRAAQSASGRFIGLLGGIIDRL